MVLVLSLVLIPPLVLASPLSPLILLLLESLRPWLLLLLLLLLL